MKIRLSAGHPFLLPLVLLSCTSERPSPQQEVAALPQLRTDAASHCEPARVRPILLDVPRAGGFLLNRAPFDSVELSTWFRAKLQGRMILVRLDSSRVGELQWLVPAIEGAGGGAYVPDSTCMPPVHAPAV